MKRINKDYLYKLTNNYIKNIDISIKDHYINEYNNKGTKLQRINKINSWDNQLYKFNKKNVINTWILDRLVSKLLIKIFKVRVNIINNNIINNGQIKDIYINKPKFKHTINKVYINFNYILSSNNITINDIDNNMNKYYTSIINDINNILGISNNNNNNIINKDNISNYLSKLYNKKVIIESNRLIYHYNDNTILNKMIINNMEKHKGGLSGKYSKILRTNIPVNNSILIRNKYISSIINNNYIKLNHIINLTSYNNLNILNIYNTLNLNKISKDLLINKYIIGLNVLYKGKNLNTAGISRSIKDRLLLGSLSNKLYGKYSNFLSSSLINNNNNNLKLGSSNINTNLNINKSYKLNYIPNHHNIITNNKVNKVKTGTFGITTKLNTI
uniref:Small ribosomal subunit protein uS3m n=1 Tax=Wickerhamomyces canadensis TaxID=1156965 RepID=RMAR_WICCA|nr:var1 ribosomal protein [Wickerhamomyces canadensis]P48849.2 RecName: Full=Small ribosomal subunit protein uS3m; AltName: Full=Ribosomal protein VAR1, mitochondrial [Wickerhamomyces canadensis]BAA06578.2 var1 ribosomal protein [Wickerhamomyces canadensis]